MRRMCNSSRYASNTDVFLSIGLSNKEELDSHCEEIDSQCLVAGEQIGAKKSTEHVVFCSRSNLRTATMRK